ncbi:unnamed protein product [Tenebrio molitor]|nr:unnamed protein product [Tenebrio molitor]
MCVRCPYPSRPAVDFLNLPFRPSDKKLATDSRIVKRFNNTWETVIREAFTEPWGRQASRKTFTKKDSGKAPSVLTVGVCRPPPEIFWELVLKDTSVAASAVRVRPRCTSSRLRCCLHSRGC